MLDIKIMGRKRLCLYRPPGSGQIVTLPGSEAIGELLLRGGDTGMSLALGKWFHYGCMCAYMFPNTLSARAVYMYIYIIAHFCFCARTKGDLIVTLYITNSRMATLE